jgi:hypothetical protein
MMVKLDFDDEDIRALYTLMHYAEKFAGLEAHNLVGRILQKLPVIETKEEKNEKVQ